MIVGVILDLLHGISTGKLEFFRWIAFYFFRSVRPKVRFLSRTRVNTQYLGDCF